MTTNQEDVARKYTSGLKAAYKVGGLEGLMEIAAFSGADKELVQHVINECKEEEKAEIAKISGEKKEVNWAKQMFAIVVMFVVALFLFSVVWGIPLW